MASKSYGNDLRHLLSSADLCSKRWIWEQYDHQVRTNTISGPGADAAVVRIKDTNTSVAMSLDGNGRYCSLDPREGTKLIVAECCRNLSTMGALPIATTNNLNFGNPERPEIMAQIVESIEGLAEACRFFEVPVTGGNVSLYNETLGTPICMWVKNQDARPEAYSEMAAKFRPSHADYTYQAKFGVRVCSTEVRRMARSIFRL